METLETKPDTYPTRHAMIHVGKQVPKHLQKLGFREVSSMHVGKGIWIFNLERGGDPVNVTGKSTLPNVEKSLPVQSSLSHGIDATTVKTSPRTEIFQAFLDSLKTPHRKVPKLSLDYATRR